MGVKYGLCNAHYAKILNTGGFAAPCRLPAAVKLSLNDHTDILTASAAGVTSAIGIKGAYKSGELEVASLPLAFLTDILGYRIQSGVLIEGKIQASHFALLFESLDNATPERFVYYDCIAFQPEFKRETIGDSVEITDEKLSIAVCRPLAKLLRGYSADFMSKCAKGEQAFDTWFDEVYV